VKGLKKGLLNRVLGVFPVMRDVLGDSEKFAIVSLYELLESSNIPVLAGMDKVQIIACHCPHCELSRVCRHIVVVSIIHVNSKEHSPSRSFACRTFM
jgi:hypothetical protein